MAIFNIKKGVDISLPNPPVLKFVECEDSSKVVFHPNLLNQLKVKLLVKEGDSVFVGSPLYIDKTNPEVKFVSSVSGTVDSIVFGKRRVVEAISIINDGSYDNVQEKINLNYSMSSDKIKSIFAESGMLSMIRQFPFDKVASPDKNPKCIVVTMFDSAPYAPDTSCLLSDENFQMFKKGLSYLSKLTEGLVYLNCREGGDIPMAGLPKNIKINNFLGPHPAGNPGIQIHHLDPIKNKDDIVWSVSFLDLVAIGITINNGYWYNRKVVSVGGSSDCNNYYDVLRGAQISSFIDNDVLDGFSIISGNLLSGKKVKSDYGVGHFDNSISLINDGSLNREFLGWLMPGFNKPTLTRTFLSSFIPNSRLRYTNNLNGSLRAIIPFGRWDKLLPMRIYPDFLVKSIIAKDIDMMESLGMYECVPEDFALCTYACQSKIEVSQIIREGLDLIEVEG